MSNACACVSVGVSKGTDIWVGIELLYMLKFTLPKCKDHIQPHISEPSSFEASISKYHFNITNTITYYSR